MPLQGLARAVSPKGIRSAVRSGLRFRSGAPRSIRAAGRTVPPRPFWGALSQLLLRVKNVFKLIYQKLIYTFRAVGGELSVLISVSASTSVADRTGEAMNSQLPPSFHGPLVSISPSSPRPGRIIEELVDKTGCRRKLFDREGRLFHAFKRCRECLHMGDSARHKELERVLRASIVAEINQPLMTILARTSAAILLRRSTSSSPVT
jgi:hypothetical protein